jgi:hypothetical protein
MTTQNITQYNIDRQTCGVNGWGLPFCGQVYSVTLAANTEETVTVPANLPLGVPGSLYNKFIVVITCEQAKKVYVASNATAAVPAGGTFAASTSELLPVQSARFVKSADVLHFISGAIADVTVAFYAIQN